MASFDSREFPERIVNGDRGALARAISLCEVSPMNAAEILTAFDCPAPRSLRLGLTGPPGVGKSTLVSKLIARLACDYERVGAIMIDPSSPISGGAVLGDRIRLGKECDSANVFIRSMASRGSLGGLCIAAGAAVRLIEHWGARATLIETVGIGQAGADVGWLADCVFLMLAPGAGDSIQVMKSGVIEIADAYIVNKCDLPGADSLIATLKTELIGEDDCEPVILKMNAKTGDGLDELMKVVDEIVVLRLEDPDARSRMERRALLELDFVFESLVSSRIRSDERIRFSMAKLSGDIASGRLDVFQAAATLLDDIWLVI